MGVFVVAAFVVAAIDPVIATVVGGFLSASVGAWALVRTKTLEVTAANRSAGSADTAATTANIAASTALLVNAQQAQITRLDAMVSARDSALEDVRADLAACEESKRTLSTEVSRQGAEIAGLGETVAWMKDELDRRTHDR